MEKENSRLLTDKEIARALEKQRMFKGKDLSGAIAEGDRLIAKDQDAKTASIIKAQEQARREGIWKK